MFAYLHVINSLKNISESLEEKNISFRTKYKYLKIVKGTFKMYYRILFLR